MLRLYAIYGRKLWVPAVVAAFLLGEVATKLVSDFDRESWLDLDLRSRMGYAVCHHRLRYCCDGPSGFRWVYPGC